MTPSSSIAHYRITAKLGEGGMGAVYRATDTKLNREVAIKILPDAFANDPERLARFTREAQVLASLNHPNIAQVYGVEDRAIVMELVEGRDVKGPVPLETALEYGRQIAAALEAAHEKGITHRDLKPANIRVTPEGQIKILDFGLAKAAASGEPTGTAENSPTLTLQATQIGMILGTAAYMAPEQAKGKSVDRRADIWAFGVVMCELLTGKPLYAGDNVSEILAQVILKEPDLQGVPAAVRPVLERCLRKDPRQRWQWIGDVQLALEEPPQASPTSAPVRQTRRWPWMAALLATGVAAGVGVWMLKPADDAPLMQFEISPPEGITIGRPTWGQYAVAPDGRSLVFVGHGADGVKKLWYRRFEATTATALDGTEDALGPAWSLDGRLVSFAANLKLKVMEIGGGPPRVLGDGGGTNTWGKGGVIVTTTAHSMLKYLAFGGLPVLATKADVQEERQGTPAYLPDGIRFIYYSSAGAKRGLRVVHADGVPGPPLDVGMAPATVAIDGVGRAWLLGGTGEELRAQRFDLTREVAEGPVFPLAIPVAPGPIWSTSRNGVLVYRRSQNQQYRSVLLDEGGKNPQVLSDLARNATVCFSPDGKRAAVQRDYHGDSGIWLIDLASRELTRFSFGKDEAAPVWSTDGKKIYFSSMGQAGVFAVVERTADGSGAERVVFTDQRRYFPASVSPDGRFLLLTASAGGTSIPFASPVAGGKPVRILEDSLGNPSFSPDGKWVLTQGGGFVNPDVFIRAVPKEAGGTGATSTWQVSKSGGIQPVWRGNQIFYIAPDGKMMSVPVVSGDTVQIGTPQPLFDSGIDGRAFNRPRQYDVSADGKRFLMREDVNVGREPPITVVFNWQKLIK